MPQSPILLGVSQPGESSHQLNVAVGPCSTPPPRFTLQAPGPPPPPTPVITAHVHSLQLGLRRGPERGRRGVLGVREHVVLEPAFAREPGDDRPLVREVEDLRRPR